MPSTVILQPLNDDDESKGVAEKKYLKIATHMNEMKNVDDVIFDDFLRELQMDLPTYLLAVWSSISSPKFFSETCTM